MMMRVLGIYGLMMVILTGVFGVVRRSQSEAMWLVYGELKPHEPSLIYRMWPDGTNVDLVAVMDDFIEPEFSSDGRWLIFSRSDESGLSEILYRMRLTGGSLQRMATLPNEDGFQPQYSPDGQWIAFVAFRDGNGQIFRMQLDGSDVLQLTDAYAHHTYPFWSPDGEWITFLSDGENGRSIYRIRPDGSDLQDMAWDKSIRVGFAASYSPDGEWMLFDAFGDQGVQFDIYRVRVNSMELYPFLDATEDSDRDPSWSSDGKWIVFQSETIGGHVDLNRIRPDGTDRQQLTDNAEIETHPVWSPVVDMDWDGRKVGGFGMGLMVLGMATSIMASQGRNRTDGRV